MNKKKLEKLDHESLYRRGILLIKKDKSISKGLKDLYLSALCGNPKALFVIGMIFKNGFKSIKLDLKASDTYFKFAYPDLLLQSEGDDAEAIRMVANYSYYGLAKVEKNEEYAIQLFEKSTALDDEESATFLSNYYKKLGNDELATTYADIALNIKEKKGNAKATISSASLVQGEVATLDSAIIKQGEGMLDSSTAKVKILNNEEVDLTSLDVRQKYVLARSLDEEENKSDFVLLKITLLYDSVFETLNESTLQRDPVEIRYLAEIYYNGYGSVDVNFEKALQYFDASARLGDVDSLNFLIDYYQNVNVDENKCEEYKKLLASLNGEPNIFTQVPTQEKETVDPEYLNYLFGEYMKACSRYDEGLFKIIRTMNKNIDSEETFRITLSMLETAAKSGNVDAMLLVAKIFREEKRWNIQNLERSIYYYKLAEANNSVIAKYHLGVFQIESDDDLHANAASGLVLIKQAAKAGYHLALSYLGDLYKEGKYVKQSDYLAVRFYKLAAERGLGSAYYKLAMIEKEKNQDYSENLRLSLESRYTPEMGDNLEDPSLLPTYEELSHRLSRTTIN